MKKYNCTVTLTSEYEIEIDDNEIGGQEFLDNYKRYFTDFDNWEEHAQHIAVSRARGFEFIEGYGIPLINGEDQRFTNKDDDTLEKAINIKVIYENEVDIESEEIE